MLRLACKDTITRIFSEWRDISRITDMAGQYINDFLGFEGFGDKHFDAQVKQAAPGFLPLLE